MKTAAPWRVRATVWALMALFLLALLAATGMLVWTTRNNALEAAHGQVTRFVAGAEVGLNRTFLSVDVLLASTGAGVLWETFGAASTFYAGAIICVVTLIGMRVMPSAYRQD